MNSNNFIRINDLRNPVLTTEAREALDEAERNPVKLNEKAVLDAARNATGLKDFGPEDFRLRLRKWLTLIEEDDERTNSIRKIHKVPAVCIFREFATSAT